MKDSSAASFERHATTPDTWLFDHTVADTGPPMMDDPKLPAKHFGLISPTSFQKRLRVLQTDAQLAVRRAEGSTSNGWIKGGRVHHLGVRAPATASGCHDWFWTGRAAMGRQHGSAPVQELAISSCPLCGRLAMSALPPAHDVSAVTGRLIRRAECRLVRPERRGC